MSKLDDVIETGVRRYFNLVHDEHYGYKFDDDERGFCYDGVVYMQPLLPLDKITAEAQKGIVQIIKEHLIENGLCQEDEGST